MTSTYYKAFDDRYVMTCKPHTFEKQMWRLRHCLLQVCFKIAFVIKRPQNLFKYIKNNI